MDVHSSSNLNASAGVSSLLLQLQQLNLDPSLQSPGRSPRPPPSAREVPASQHKTAQLQYAISDMSTSRQARAIAPSVITASCLSIEELAQANDGLPVLIEKTSDTAMYFLKLARPFPQMTNGVRANFDQRLDRFFRFLKQDGDSGHKFHLLLCAEAIHTMSKEHIKLLQTCVSPFSVKIIYRLSCHIQHTRQLHEKLLDIILQANKLEQLDFSNCSTIEAQNLNELIAVTPRGCTELILDYCGWLTDSDIAKLCQTPQFQFLESISLSGCTRVADQGLCALFSYNKGIKKLALNECLKPGSLLTHRFLEFLNEKKYTSLLYLELDGCTITAEVVAALCNAHYRLVKLSISGCDNLQPQWIAALQQKHTQVVCTYQLMECQSGQLSRPTHTGPSHQMLVGQMVQLERIREQKWVNTTLLSQTLEAHLGPNEVVSDGTWFSFHIKEIVTRQAEPLLSEELLGYLKGYKVSLTIPFAAITHSSKTMAGRFLRELAPYCMRVILTPGMHQLGEEHEPVCFSRAVEFSASHTPISGEHFAYLQFTELQYLVLQNCRNIQSIVPYLPGLQGLRELDIRKCAVSEQEVVQVLQKVSIHTLVRFIPPGLFEHTANHDDTVRLLVNLRRVNKIQYSGITRGLAQKLTITDENYAALESLAFQYNIEQLDMELKVWLQLKKYSEYFEISRSQQRVTISFKPMSRVQNMLEGHWSFLATFQRSPIALYIRDDLKAQDQHRKVFLQKITTHLGAAVECISYHSMQNITLPGDFCARLKNIKEVQFASKADSIEVILFFLQQCPSLDTLTIESCSDRDRKKIASYLQNFKNITKLYLLPNLQLKEQGLDAILAQAHHLVELHLPGATELTDAVLQKHLPQMHYLRVLHVGGCNKLTDRAFNGVNFLTLARLDLSSTVVTEEGLKRLLFASPMLKELRLNNTNASLRNATLPVLLEELQVQGCLNINDQSLSCIAQGAEHLRLLDLSGCQVTAKGILQILKICHKIETIKVDSSAHMPRPISEFLQPQIRYMQTLDVTGRAPYPNEVLEIMIRRGIGISYLLASYSRSSDLQYLETIFKMFHERRKQLKTLEFRTCTEDPAVVFVGLSKYLQSVKRMYLGGKITAITALNLAPYKNLAVLSLNASIGTSENPIQDDTLVALVAVLAQLERIHLENLHFITVEGVKRMIASNKTLQHISIKACTKITNAEIEALKSQYTHISFA